MSLFKKWVAYLAASALVMFGFAGTAQAVEEPPPPLIEVVNVDLRLVTDESGVTVPVLSHDTAANVVASNYWVTPLENGTCDALVHVYAEGGWFSPATFAYMAEQGWQASTVETMVNLMYVWGYGVDCGYPVVDPDPDPPVDPEPEPPVNPDPVTPGNGNAPPHAGQPGPPPHAGEQGPPAHANPGKGNNNGKGQGRG